MGRSAVASRLRALLAVAVALLASACATLAPAPPAGPEHAYVAADDGSLLARYAPVLVPERAGRRYNRVGTAAAAYDEEGGEHVFVDPSWATVYGEVRTFSTARADYTNLIYRVHFEKVPFRLIPFHLTAGPNGGLVLIVTLNGRGEPVLLTTVHSCGCYLAFVPTSYLPARAYPDDWPVGHQRVYGEVLTARLDYPSAFDAALRPLVRLRDGTHRVMGVELADVRVLGRSATVTRAALLPMSALDAVPIGAGTTSFFREHGLLRGHVKDTFKPFEFALMSWWTLDAGVGVDKALGDPSETGTVFYTSLKPWRREASDMWRFARFLAYWGWRL
jgi:hypothetical protein